MFSCIGMIVSYDPMMNIEIKSSESTWLQNYYYLLFLSFLLF